MYDWPIGISTGMFYATDFFGCIRQIREAGFSVVEICSSKEHLDYHSGTKIKEAARLLRELQLEPYSFHAPFGEEIDITSQDQSRRDYALREVQLALNAAAELDARYFVFHPGPDKTFDPSPQARLECMNRAADALNMINEQCRGRGMTMLLENMLPHLFGGNIQEMLWVIGAIHDVDVCTCLDTGHAYLAGTLREMTHKLAAGLRLIHVNDNHGGGDDHLPPPQGRIDWPPFLDDLKTINYSGVLMLELASRDHHHLDKNLAAAGQARQYLRRLL